jgi:DNA-binding PadR family transcriptional regulator
MLEIFKSRHDGRHRQHAHHPHEGGRGFGGGRNGRGDGERGGGHGRRGPKMFDAGDLRFVVLRLIADQPRHGYEIIKEIEQRAGGGYSPSPGVIYPLLALLEDLGHVRVTPDGNRKLHSITPEGLAFLADNQAHLETLQARWPSDSHSGVRRSLHRLKEVVVERVRGGTPTPEQLARIEAILLRATLDIEGLE